MVKTNTAVAVKEETLPATDVLDVDFAADANLGLQGIGTDDLSIPFLTIIQSNSPQRKRGDAKQIPGADEGHVFNTVSNRLWKTPDEPLYVVPCAFEKKYLRWAERDEGGGLKGTYAPNDPILQQVKKDPNKPARLALEDGTYLSPTAEHYVLVIDPKTWTYERAVLSMTSTQLKKSRKWNTIMHERKLRTSDGRPYTPPTFATIYVAKTVYEKNDQGSWFGWALEPYSADDNADGLVRSREVYEAAKAFNKSVHAGDVKVSAERGDADVSGSGGGIKDDEIPF
jgi:hypothetical protein